MKKIEGQEAINYLARLVSLEDLDRETYQHQLLFTMLKIELAVLQSLPEENDGRYLFVTASGFPSIPTTLARVQHAIKLHFQNVVSRQYQVQNWLESIGNLSSDQIREQSKILSQKQNPSPKIADAFKEVSPAGVSFLNQANFKEDSSSNIKAFPISTPKKRPSILLATRIGTPFRDYDGSYPEAHFRKYIDSPTLPENFVIGSENEPLPKKKCWDCPKHPRISVLVTGSTDYEAKKLRPDPRQLTRLVPAYVQYSPEGNGEPKIQKEEIQSETHNQLKKLLLSESPIVPAFLDIDFTNLSDQTTDHIVESLPVIATLSYNITTQAKTMAKNQVLDFPTTDEKAQELARLINAIEDTSARQAIQIAIKKVLNQTKNDLTFHL